MWQFIKKHWKGILAFITGAFGSLLAIILSQKPENPVPPHVPEPDVKELDRKVDAKAEADKKAVDAKAEEDIKKVETMTTEEAVAVLDNGTQMKIDKIKKDAVEDTTASIMDRIMKEQQNG